MKIDTHTRYLIEKGVLRLVEQGIIDPTLVEISLLAFDRPLPDKRPWIETDELGGEIYAGTNARIKKIRDALEQNYDMLTLPVSIKYYETGQRDRLEPPTEVDVEFAMPQSNRKTVGIRVVKPDERDPYYPLYLMGKGARAAGTIKRTISQTGKAVEIGALETNTGVIVAQLIDDHIGEAPAAMAKRLANGNAKRVEGKDS